MEARQFQRPPHPPMPKIEDDGNPRFVTFIRMANDEKEIQKTAIKQHRVLWSATKFRYGYKLVGIILVTVSYGATFIMENGNMRAAISTNDVIELPRQDELKPVVDKVKDFFGDAKESFGKLTSLDSTTTTEAEENPAKNLRSKAEGGGAFD